MCKEPDLARALHATCASHLLQAFVYRRVQSSQPFRTWRGPCSVVVHERLLLPNLGREGAVFMVSGSRQLDPWKLYCHCSRQGRVRY